MKIQGLILGLCFVGMVDAQEIKVELYSDQSLPSATFQLPAEPYHLLAVTSSGIPIDTIWDLPPNAQIKAVPSGSSVAFSLSGSAVGSFKNAQLRPSSEQAACKISGSGKQREYCGAIWVRPGSGELEIINTVDLEEYVAGVVESEGGHEPEFEYFKAQAVLARTFALKNWNKHRSNGYNLKDDVTSQVYKSRARHKHAELIRKAVEETRGEVLVDASCEPILGAFYANSGGQTANSEEAWLNAVAYLRTKSDPFSLGQPSESWEKRISKKQFMAYFARQLGQQSSDPFFQKAVLNLRQDQRISSFRYKGKSLPLKHVRTHFNLRSTFFDVYDDGNDVVLRGRGYGHGVGLSQDGAINMSRLGFCYDEILYFYYNQVELERLP